MEKKKIEVERAAFGVDEFCKAHGICRSNFYALVNAGEGPRIFKAGTRTLVSKEAAADWRAARELASSQGVKVAAAK